MRRSWLAIATLMVVLSAGSGCRPFNGSSDSGGGSAPVTSSTKQSDPAAGNADAVQFCALAKEKGAANLQVFDAQSSTPEQAHQVLVNIDDLTAAAPAEIHADFVRFDTFEHKLFDAGGNASGALAQEAGGQELRDALTRIAAYLHEHCGIGG